MKLLRDSAAGRWSPAPDLLTDMTAPYNYTPVQLELSGSGSSVAL